MLRVLAANAADVTVPPQEAGMGSVVSQGGEAAAYLDHGTQLVSESDPEHKSPRHSPNASWNVKVIEAARRCVAYEERPPSDEVIEARARRRCTVLDKPRTPEHQAQVDEQNKARSSRRARTELVDYVIANALSHLWTLTYAKEGGEHDEATVKRHVNRFCKRLRDISCIPQLPFAYVLELHPGGHGWHVHFALGQRVPWPHVLRAWRRGRIDPPKLSKGKGRSRAVAGYLAKYLAKTFTGPQSKCKHRYELAQGFKPGAVVYSASSEAEAYALMCAIMGGDPYKSWSSRDYPDWCAPIQAFGGRWP